MALSTSSHRRVLSWLSATAVTLTLAGVTAAPAAAGDARPANVPRTPIAVASPAPGVWRYNGSATQSGGDTVLTPANRSTVAGTVIDPVPVSPAGVHVRFTAEIGGGSGGDGMAFALLDTATGTPTSVGDTGGGFGIEGLDGYLVGLDTYRNPTDSGGNNVGISRTTVAGFGRPPTWLATAPVPTPLREGTHVVDVTVGAGLITATVDDAVTVSARVSLFPAAYLAFGGGNGGATDRHVVRDVTITRPASRGPIVNRQPDAGCLTVALYGQPEPVTVAPCTDTDRQLWTLDPSGELVGSKGCLDVPDDVVKIRVDLVPCTAAPGQLWQPQLSGSLRNTASDLCLDTRGMLGVEGTRVVVFRCNPTVVTQRWTLPL